MIGGEGGGWRSVISSAATARTEGLGLRDVRCAVPRRANDGIYSLAKLLGFVFHFFARFSISLLR